MGTSISQPSPRGRSSEGKAWEAAKNTQENRADARDLIAGIANAVNVEFEDEAHARIVDSGVLLVEKAVLGFALDKSVDSQIPDFVESCRRALVLEQANSFFAELSLSAAVAALAVSDSKSLSLNFSVGYVAAVFDYYISRDLPQTYGSHGLTSPRAIELRLQEVRAEIFKFAQGIKGRSVSDLALRILEAAQ